MPAPHRRPTGRAGSRRLWHVVAFTASLAVTTGVLWSMAVPHLGPPRAPVRLPWPLLAALFAAARILVIQFEFRAESVELTLGEVPLLVGLAVPRRQRARRLHPGPLLPPPLPQHLNQYAPRA